MKKNGFNEILKKRGFSINEMSLKKVAADVIFGEGKGKKEKRERSCHAGFLYQNSNAAMSYY